MSAPSLGPAAAFATWGLRGYGQLKTKKTFATFGPVALSVESGRGVEHVGRPRLWYAYGAFGRQLGPRRVLCVPRALQDERARAADAGGGANTYNIY